MWHNKLGVIISAAWTGTTRNEQRVSHVKDDRKGKNVYKMSIQITKFRETVISMGAFIFHVILYAY